MTHMAEGTRTAGPTGLREGHILFVCTGNTCRSPMAEAFANHYLKEAGLGRRWFATSAGTAVWERLPAAEEAVRVMKGYGLDISRHRARGVEDIFLGDTSLVLGMTQEHVRIMKHLFPEKTDGVFRFADFAARVNGVGGVRKASVPGDIPDPFGLDPDAYREVAGILSSLARDLVQRLSGADSGFCSE